MKRREKISDSIPIDLFLEILSRLPAKSVARFRCVSKLWGSMICRPYFTELFLTRSSARPRLLFAVKHGGEWVFLSSPQPQNPYEKSSPVVDGHAHIKFPGDISRNLCSYASGLLYFPSMQITKENEDTVRVVCNPITGEYWILPKVRKGKKIRTVSFLGFDPIDEHFKVLIMDTTLGRRNCDPRILTIGTGKEWWRKIKCPFTVRPLFGGICINGVLYYIGYDIDEGLHVIVCFDVRSEKFKLLNGNPNCFFDWSPRTTLINYKGKLGMADWNYADSGGFPLELCMWVLEDVEKQEWCEYVYTLWDENGVAKVDNNLFVVGVTATGEIVLSMEHTCKPFYVFYFNPEKNTLQTVEIKGFGEYLEAREIRGRVCAFVDHVEDLYL